VLDEYVEEESRLDIQVRTFKTNHAPVEPFGISIQFAGDEVRLETRELPDEELIDEERAPVAKRILAALKNDDLTAEDLERLTGASFGTIRNKLSELMSGDDPQVQEAGYKGRKKLYARCHHHRDTPGVSDDDDNENDDDGELF
jgi:hypothetical protein